MPRAADAIPELLGRLGTALSLVLAALLVWAVLTPWDDLALIRRGNRAASILLSGELVGFALPVSVVLARDGSYGDLLLWGGVSIAAQAVLFTVIRLAEHDLARAVDADQTGPAVFAAALAVTTGLLAAGALAGL